MNHRVLKVSLWNLCLFWLCVYSWSLMDEVTWPSIWETVLYIIKTKQISGKEPNTEVSKSQCASTHPSASLTHPLSFSLTNFFLGDIGSLDILYSPLKQGPASRWLLVFLILCLVPFYIFFIPRRYGNTFGAGNWVPPPQTCQHFWHTHPTQKVTGTVVGIGKL